MRNNPLQQQYTAALTGGKDLPVFLRSCLDLAARGEQQANIHPVVITNALKNIIGDDKQNPSPVLLEYLFSINDEIKADSNTKILNEVGSKGITDPVFIMDLEDAVQDRKWVDAEKHAAALFLAAEYKGSVLEVLTEIALQNAEIHAAFFYHHLRGAIFFEPTKYYWSFIRSGVTRLKENPVSEPHAVSAVSPEDAVSTILHTDKAEDLITFASCWRLWEIDCVRQKGFRREISFWLNRLRNDHKYADDSDGSRFPGGKPNFIELSEKVIRRKIKQEEKQRTILLLEAIRFLWTKVEDKFKPLLIKQLNEISKQ